MNETYKKDYKGYYVDKNYSGKVQNFINGPIEIESRTINSLIEEHSDFLNTTNIDLISIDVDGSEEYVLPGFDILKYKPRIIIFEVSVVRSVVENYMQDKNYYKIYDNRLNVIYCRDIEDLKIFNDEFNKIKKQNKILISADTGHPLGN